MATHPTPFTQRLAAYSANHPYRTIGLWVICCVITGVLAATQLSPNLTSSFSLSGDYQSVRAKAVLEEAGLPPVTDTRETVLLDAGDALHTDDQAFKDHEQATAERLRQVLSELLSEEASAPVNVSALTLEHLEAGTIPTPSVIDRQSVTKLVEDEKARREAEFTRRGEDLGARGTALQARQSALEETTKSIKSQASRGVLVGVELQAAMDKVTAEGEALTREAAALEDDRATLDAEVAKAQTDGEQQQADVDAFLDSLTGKDKHASLIVVNAGKAFSTLDIDRWKTAVKETSTASITATTLGQTSIQDEFTHIVEEDLVQAELAGVPITLLVLIVVFGAVVAAVNSLLLAVVAITGALGLTAIVSQFMTLQLFVTNMISMLGLAVGIDYCLFVTERYREERRQGRSVTEAITLAGGTSGMAMTFSGATVILSLLGIMFVPLNVYQSMSTGAVLVVAVAVAAVLTLLPAVLVLLGDRINWPIRTKRRKVQGDEIDQTWLYGGFFGKVTKLSVKKPWFVLIGSVVVLLALAAPAMQLKTGFVGADSLPRGEVSTAVHRLYDQWAEGQLFPVEVVATNKESITALEGIELDLSIDPLVEATAPMEQSATRDVARLDVYLTTSPSDPESYEWIRHFRDKYSGSGAEQQIMVGGQSAGELDMQIMLEPTTPLAIAFVLALSFILLMIAFRSIVVPIKAMVYNILSVGATYGVMTLVFAKGYGLDLLGYAQTPTIEAWLPILLFCVLFGLSMDYHVFILSRIREHYDATGNNTESVAVGIRSTSRIITGAALIMVVVFLTFSFGSATQIQQLGFGLAVAVFLDATIIRSLLVPSLMVLMNDLNWWLPPWLQWLPRINVEGTPTPPARS